MKEFHVKCVLASGTTLYVHEVNEELDLTFNKKRAAKWSFDDAQYVQDYLNLNHKSLVFNSHHAGLDSEL